jgi:hypothetical protein
MPNVVKYSLTTQANTLKKGNVVLGMNSVEYGPTSATGFWNGIEIPAGGYVMYIPYSNGSGMTIYSMSNDTELIKIVNEIGLQSFTTAAEALAWTGQQTGLFLVNREYENIVTDGLVMNLDAGFTPSYLKSGTTWYDIIGANNGTLTNGPAFNSSNGGSIIFDGSDDRTDFSNNILTGLSNSGISFDAWVFPIANLGSQQMVAGAWSQSATNDQAGLFIIGGGPYIAVADGSTGESGAGFGSLSLNQWQNIVGTWNPNREYKTYINGEIKGTGTQTGNGYNMSGSSLFRVGAQNQGEPRFFNGRIAIVRIYNRTLTGAEITQNYNAQKSRFDL